MGFEFEHIGKKALSQHQRARRSETDWNDQGLVWESVRIEDEYSAEDVLPPSQEGIELIRDEVYDCAFCKGTGEKPRGAVCSACKGKKQIHLTPSVVKCAACKGKGEERPRTNITCTPCRGTGWIAVREPLEKCQACLGRGKTSGSNLPCVTCKGAGVATIRIGGY